MLSESQAKSGKGHWPDKTGPSSGVVINRRLETVVAPHDWFFFFDRHDYAVVAYKFLSHEKKRPCSGTNQVYYFHV